MSETRNLMTERACCDDIIEAQGHIEALQRDAKEFRAFMQEMREAMTYRLPLWATFTMSALSGIVGWLLASR